MSIKKEIESLQSSPLFQLSLGSKELFHSNFLAWLFETYPQESGRALSRFLKKDEGSAVVLPVLREQKNRDLTINFKNGQQLIIENKVKSLPYIEQLEMYSSDAKDNQNFLLLSLMSPPFAEKGVIETGHATWNTLTYSELPVVIRQIGLNIVNEYHCAILSDYALFISSLSSIFASNSYGDDDMFADFYSGSAIEQLRPLRMDDIYQKLRYEALAGRIYQTLARRYPVHSALSAARDGDREIGHMYVSHGMSNAQGMVTVEYVIAKGLYLTVQIQGDSYRQMVAGYAGYGPASRGVAERLKAKHLWFDFSNFGATKEYPGKKDFNKFDHDFYRSINLDPKFTVAEVVEFVVKDIERIENTKHEILRELR